MKIKFTIITKALELNINFFELTKLTSKFRKVDD